MNLTDFLRTTNLDHSLIIGYYGGGNYGDELLLEVLCNLLSRQGAQPVRLTYQFPASYSSMHRDFGFALVNIHSYWTIAQATLKSKHILIGGGGLWGVDINANTLLLSLYLFISRWVLRKQVYLLGVGYYGSTSWMGRVGAWLAGKASNLIFARDNESLANFGRIARRVELDRDLAWQIKNLDLTPYAGEAAALQKRLPIDGKTLVAAVRRPQAGHQRQAFLRFNKLIGWLIESNPNRPIILAMLELESKDPALYEQARKWRRRHKHLRIIEAPYNPLTLFAYIRANHKRLALIAPQLHLLLTAQLCQLPFLPLVYDNKVSELLDQIGVPANKRLPLADVSGEQLQAFADEFFGGNA